MKRLQWYFLLTSLAILFAIAGFMLRQWMEQPKLNHQQAIKVPEIRPEFALPDLTQKIQNINQWDGKVIVLNFWATWCPPCLKEIPGFVELQQKYAAQDVQFIGVALDEIDPVREFATKHHINYPILMANMMADLSTQYGNYLGALPFTVLIDREGKIVSTHYKSLSKQQVEGLLTTLL